MSEKLCRRVCFVTGTRAEYGLMRTTLAAIQSHPQLRLQVLATGTHLLKAHGQTAKLIEQDGFNIDAAVPWRQAVDPPSLAVHTAAATAKIAAELNRLNPHIVLVVGDRVEALAGATAGHLGGRVVAHVHGGDRALGQIDDCLRHAITKLSHIHFPATKQSRDRLVKLGEDRWRIHLVGSAGIDGIRTVALPAEPADRRRSALIVLHPTGTDEDEEFARAQLVLSSVLQTRFDRVDIISANNDPGASGIVRCWKSARGATVMVNVDRARFLGMIRDAAVLVGNSSSGIIEAASFGTPVVDIGDRQAGRERSGNVVHVPFNAEAIDRVLTTIWNHGRPRRWRGANVYSGAVTGQKIAAKLADLCIDNRLCRKVIAY